MDILENIGLTKSEIKVYLALLEQNTGTATEISEKTGLYRKNVYDAFLRLSKKGLISSSNIDGKKFFTASAPEKLLEFLNAKKENVNQIMGELKNLYKSKPLSDDAQIYKGKEGIKTIFEDILKSKADYDKFGTGEKFMDMLQHYYLVYQKNKSKYKIRCRAIYSENERNEPFVKEFIGKTKFLSKKFINPATTIIYADRVAIIIWKETPFGILIHSKDVAESYRYYFDSLWEMALN